MNTDPQAFLGSAEFGSFVERGGSRVTPATLHRLAALLPELRERFPHIEAPGFPAIVAQLNFVALVIETVAADKYRDLSYGAIGEAAFALLYLSRDVDLIPDSVERIGYLDDAAVTALVVQRHAAEFGEFASHLGCDWHGLAPATSANER